MTCEEARGVLLALNPAGHLGLVRIARPWCGERVANSRKWYALLQSFFRHVRLFLRDSYVRGEVRYGCIEVVEIRPESWGTSIGPGMIAEVLHGTVEE